MHCILTIFIHIPVSFHSPFQTHVTLYPGFLNSFSLLSAGYVIWGVCHSLVHVPIDQ